MFRVYCNGELYEYPYQGISPIMGKGCSRYSERDAARIYARLWLRLRGIYQTFEWKPNTPIKISYNGTTTMEIRVEPDLI